MCDLALNTAECECVRAVRICDCMSVSVRVRV